MPYGLTIPADFYKAPAGIVYRGAGGSSGSADHYSSPITLDDAEDEISGYLTEMDMDDDAEAEPAEVVPKARKLDSHYTMEKSDPTHRMGDLLTAAGTIWSEARAGTRRDEYNARGQDLISWLDNIPEWQRVVLIKEKLLAFGKRDAENLRPSMVKAFIGGVKYLDKAGRKRYRVEVHGGRLWRGSEAFDTIKLETAFSGLGFAIWVLSKTDKFYAGSHRVGQFHHSSFLSGGKVMCGGEMVVQGGKLRLLTGKSGHYKPKLKHLVYAVQTLRKQSIDLSTFRVQIWTSTCTAPVAPTGQEFLARQDEWEAWSGCSHPNHQRLKRADWDR